MLMTPASTKGGWRNSLGKATEMIFAEVKKARQTGKFGIHVVIRLVPPAPPN